MKRKRKSQRNTSAIKRQKTGDVSKNTPTWPLLRQYYSNVVTLRQYLASRLSKKGRKKFVHYGLDGSDNTDPGADPLVVQLLDGIVVGAFTTAEVSDVESIDKDITIFTQQLSDSAASISATQGALKQSEVHFHTRLRFCPSLPPSSLTDVPHS